MNQRRARTVATWTMPSSRFCRSRPVDESAPRDIAERAVAQVSDTAHEVGADRVMIYPYAHLSSDLARPRMATKVIAPLRPPSGEG